MSETAWLFVAFAAVWIAIGAYLFSIGARQRRLEQRMEALDRHKRTNNAISPAG